MSFRFARSLWLLAALYPGASLCSQNGQTSGGAQGQPSLRAFYEAVLQNPSYLPKHEDLHSLTNRIDSTMSAKEVEQGLPLSFKLSHTRTGK